MATGPYEVVYQSDDYGSTVYSNEGFRMWNALAMSGDGSVIVVNSATSDQLRVCTNFSSWTLLDPTSFYPSLYVQWTSVAVSGTSTRYTIHLCGRSGGLFFSYPGGFWTQTLLTACDQVVVTTAIQQPSSHYILSGTSVYQVAYTPPYTTLLSNLPPAVMIATSGTGQVVLAVVSGSPHDQLCQWDSSSGVKTCSSLPSGTAEPFVDLNVDPNGHRMLCRYGNKVAISEDTGSTWADTGINNTFTAVTLSNNFALASVDGYVYYSYLGPTLSIIPPSAQPTSAPTTPPTLMPTVGPKTASKAGGVFIGYIALIVVLVVGATVVVGYCIHRHWVAKSNSAQAVAVCEPQPYPQDDLDSQPAPIADYTSIVGVEDVPPVSAAAYANASAPPVATVSAPAAPVLCSSHGGVEMVDVKPQQQQLEQSATTTSNCV